MATARTHRGRPLPLAGEGDRRQAVEGGAASSALPAPPFRPYRATFPREREKAPQGSIMFLIEETR
jgi:hypothetical protein